MNKKYNENCNKILNYLMVQKPGFKFNEKILKKEFKDISFFKIQEIIINFGECEIIELYDFDNYILCI